MATYGDLKNLVTAYCKRTLSSDFNINSNADILALAINNARRYAERINDFHFCEIDAFLSIGSSGGDITNAYTGSGTVTLAGTTYPATAGSYTRGGTYATLPFYTKTLAQQIVTIEVNGTPSPSATFNVNGQDYWFYVDGTGSGSGNQISVTTGQTNAQIAAAIEAVTSFYDTTVRSGAILAFPGVFDGISNTGALTLTQYANGIPLVLYYDSTAWKVRPYGFFGSAGFNLTTSSSSPAGSYTAAGAAIGTPTATVGTGATIGIKRISDVLLPVADGDYQPIEYLTNDEFVRRTRRSVGRQAYNANRTIESLGFSLDNPLCYQQGQTLYLAPGAGFSFPVLAKLSIIRWLDEYDNDADTDFITERAPDFMLWQSVLEVNKYWKDFAPRQEGNIDEEALSAQRDAALTALLRWDASLTNGTSSPEERMRQVPPPNIRAEV